jgi:hypothetical protein
MQTLENRGFHYEARRAAEKEENDKLHIVETMDSLGHKLDKAEEFTILPGTGEAWAVKYISCYK